VFDGVSFVLSVSVDVGTVPILAFNPQPPILGAYKVQRGEAKLARETYSVLLLCGRLSSVLGIYSPREKLAMKFRIVVEHDPETKSYAAYCPELPGCCSAGDTEEEALANAKEAIMLYLEPAPVTLKPDEKVFEVEVPV
jgi:predicted RNase H-like HicB family nuclease